MNILLYSDTPCHSSIHRIIHSVIQLIFTLLFLLFYYSLFSFSRPVIHSGTHIHSFVCVFHSIMIIHLFTYAYTFLLLLVC
jgi:hypothetical protein